MTRALHPETKVQRAESADAAPEAERERGYEESDAPFAGVLGGVAGLLGLMVAGLALVALLLWRLDTGEPPPGRLGEVRVLPPEPRLLAGPAAEAPEEMGFASPPPPLPGPAEPAPAAIARAMRTTAARGWGEDAPAPSTPETARDHMPVAR